MMKEPRITRIGTDKGRDTQGCAWQARLALRFQIPFTSKLARDCEKPIAHFATQWPCFSLSPLPQSGIKNTGLRLVSKRGCVVKKHPQARLQVSFSQQLQHSHSESTPCFLVFPSVYILVIRG
jgi:hypothetical protein